MTTTTAATPWPTMAELRDEAMGRLEAAAHALDVVDIRLSAIVRNEDRPTPSSENIAALAAFIELSEMDVQVTNDGLTAARSALHLAVMGSWEASNAS